jgi:hypothetical protein
MKRNKFGLFVVLLETINWAALQNILWEKRDLRLDWPFVSEARFCPPLIW